MFLLVITDELVRVIKIPPEYSVFPLTLICKKTDYIDSYLIGKLFIQQ